MTIGELQKIGEFIDSWTKYLKQSIMNWAVYGDTNAIVLKSPNEKRVRFNYSELINLLTKERKWEVCAASAGLSVEHFQEVLECGGDFSGNELASMIKELGIKPEEIEKYFFSF